MVCEELGSCCNAVGPGGCWAGIDGPSAILHAPISAPARCHLSTSHLQASSQNLDTGLSKQLTLSAHSVHKGRSTARYRELAPAPSYHPSSAAFAARVAAIPTSLRSCSTPACSACHRWLPLPLKSRLSSPRAICRIGSNGPHRKS